MSRFLNSAIALLLVVFSSSAYAQSAHATAELLLNTDRLTPGQQGIAALVVTIADAYHAQSSAPLDPNLIPFRVTAKFPSPAVALDPLYPPGELEEFPALGGKLSVYTHRVVAFIPFTVAEDAKPGAIEVAADVRLQLCNDESCDRPRTIPLKVATTIAANGEATKTTNAAVFKEFDANKWLAKQLLPTTGPTTQVASGETSPLRWIPFSDDALVTARKRGNPVIVDFTAAWCVNCHVVERRVYGDAATLGELQKRGATLLRADLTEDGAAGSDLLAQLNASRSIPFTAVYVAGKKTPAGLTGIYSSPDLFAAIDSGRGNAWDFTALPLVAKLAIALGIGVLLNVVPCVLPVLPLKAMSFYEDAGHDRGRSMLNGGAFAFGIVLTFGILALFVITQDALWGKFISSPITAAILAAVLLAAAAQSFGLFEIALPRALTKLDGAGGSTFVGNVFGGALIAVLSTPCTVGPFAGIIAAAIKLGLPVGPVLLMFVGLGMALPWFALSAFPEVTRRFPRTGPWPLVVKQMTAFLLLATAIFFAAPLLPAAFRASGLWWVIFGCVAASAIFLVARTIAIAPRTRPIIVSTCVAGLLIAGGLAMTLALSA